MSHEERAQYTRRQFLHSGLTLASASIAVPHFLQASAWALPRPLAGLTSIAGADENRVLVVVQLSGGNDGLNMLVPFRDDAYYRARSAINIPRDRVLTLGARDDVGLHPNMAGVKSLYDEGLCSIVQGVGYPNPNRSHFKSMDIWHTADTSGTGDGWLGKYFDAECCGFGSGESGTAPANAKTAASNDVNGQAGIAIGRAAPLAMQGRKVKPISFETEDLFRWTGEDIHKDLVDPYQKIVRAGVREGVDADSNAAFLMRTALDAQVSSETIRRAVRQRPLVQYPRSDLGNQLSMVGSMIRAGLPTRVYYVNQGGYDTHAGQGGPQGRHAQLLGQFSDAVRAFVSDMQEQGNDKRVMVMSFSEFGRRVGQNASGGTDHGTASSMLLFGPMVKPGLAGRYPSLTDLDQGDLKFTTDFRGVYAGVLEGWMGAKSEEVLGERFKAVDVVKANS